MALSSARATAVLAFLCALLGSAEALRPVSQQPLGYAGSERKEWALGYAHSTMPGWWSGSWCTSGPCQPAAPVEGASLQPDG